MTPSAFRCAAFALLLATLPVTVAAHSHAAGHSHSPQTSTVPSRSTPKSRLATPAVRAVVLRVGQAVPPLSLQKLHDAEAGTHRVLDVHQWKSSAGDKSLSLLFVGTNWKPDWTNALAQAATSLSSQRAPQQWVVIVPDERASSSAKSWDAARSLSSSTSAVMVVRDENAKTRAMFGLEPSVSTWVQIDRAGFLRAVRPLRDKTSLSNVLRQSTDPTPMLAEGQPAPDFAVRDMNGKVRSLREFRGRKNLLLTFFPKCFTGGCVIHLSSLRDEYAKLQAADVEVIAVSVDAANGEHGQRAFAKNLNLPFDFIPDTGRNLSILYGAALSPEQVASRMTILIDKNGVVRWIDRQINLQTHGADVLAKVEFLGLTR